MNRIYAFVFLVLTIFLVQCSGSKLEEGDDLYNQGNYSQAINSYLEYKKSNPDDKSVNPKIALSYMHKGNQLYKKTRNIETFNGNFKRAQDILETGFTVPQHKKEYSDLLYELAVAYKKTPSENTLQKEQYFDYTLDYLSLALDYNPDNKKADSLISKIYQDNFQQMFDKGVQFYDRAQKEKNNPDLYLSAESYLSKAVAFSFGDEQAEKYLSKTRQKTLGILKSHHPISFCVPAYKIDKGIVFIDLTAQNFSNEPINFELSKLKLTSFDGEVFDIDLQKTKALEKAIVDKTVIAPRKRIDGQLIFSIKPNVRLETISYQVDDKNSVIKYFP
jgi:tetratricopeptide (TPR) repeat protein